MVPRANASCHCASSISSKYPSPGPMVWTKLFSCPHRSVTAEKPAAMESASAMSTLMPTASGAPAARRVSSAASRAALFLAITATLAPSAARVSAIARPIPLLPPVTTAVDPVKPRSMFPPAESAAGLSGSGDSSDRLGCDTEAAKAEAERVSADITAFAVACRPLAFGVRPHHTLYGQRLGQGVDAAEHALIETALELFSERFEHRGVRRLDHLRGGEHLRLGLQREATKVGFDVIVERQVEPCVDPSRYRIDGAGGVGHLLPQPTCLNTCHLQEDRSDQLILGLEVAVEGTRAELGVRQDGCHAEPPDALFPNAFRGGRENGATDLGVGGEFLPSPGGRASHAVAS